MVAELLQFLAAHGTAVIVAGTLLGAVGLMQWRKVHIAELELAFRERMLERGVTLDELERLLNTHCPMQRGLLEQFGTLSGGTKAGVVVAGTISLIVALSVVGGSIQNYAFWEHVRQQQAYRPTSAPIGAESRFTLRPERPTVQLDESGTAVCRVHLTDGYVVYELQMVAAISEQDNLASELRVEITPDTLPKAEDAEVRRYCDVKLQSVRGTGRFTILVTAADPYRQQAQTTFDVLVGLPGELHASEVQRTLAPAPTASAPAAEPALAAVPDVPKEPRRIPSDGEVGKQPKPEPSLIDDTQRPPVNPLLHTPSGARGRYAIEGLANNYFVLLGTQTGHCWIRSYTDPKWRDLGSPAEK